MTEYKSDLLRELSSRGYIHQMTNAKGLDALARKQVVPGYIGFDATAPSLHVGSLVQIMMLRRLQQSGHKPIVLMGGGTSKVGDPSGKDESRRLLDEATIQQNIRSIKRVFRRFLKFGSGPTDAKMVDNDAWLKRLKYIPFLRNTGTHFTINRMLTFESVKLRLRRKESLTFLEFNYMILQAYDFLELSRRIGCQLQMGGSDQWGNIVNGIELARRIDGTQLYGLTTPLITTAGGGKMGKTASGAIWLNAAELSAYDYWQYWRNTHDADVPRFLKLFTDLPLRTIGQLLRGNINAAKMKLADEATALLHGRPAARRAAMSAVRTFEEGASGEELPRFSVGANFISLADALVSLGLCGSKKEARRLIAQGGASIDGERVADEFFVVPVKDQVRISAGKKKHGLLTP